MGEEGRYHTESEENPAPITGKITFALVGNQNCGKTTLFNALTGSNQHVGNFPGVTVDRKSGVIKGHPDTEVVDLPGIYSLSPYTSEEIVSRQFIFNSKPQGIINIVDATNIERNLYLTMQLMELGIPMVLALNMMDEVRNNGGTIDINELETSLGIPVVPISAAKNEGVEELVDHAIHVARYQEGPRRADFCSPTDHGGAVHRCIHAVIHLIEDHAQAAGIPLRFAACKVVEGDARVIEALHLTDNERGIKRERWSSSPNSYKVSMQSCRDQMFSKPASAEAIISLMARVEGYGKFRPPKRRGMVTPLRPALRVASRFT